MKKVKRRGILFDMDGVLVLTEHLKLQAHSAAAVAFGGTAVTPVIYARYMGKPHDFVCESFAMETGAKAAVTDFSRVFQAHYSKLIVDGPEISAGCLDLLHRLRRDGYQLGIVTSSSAWMLEQVLTTTGLGDYFEVTICADDVDEEKPKPAPYLLGLKKLQLSAESALVFEDTEAGILAAHRAGIPVIGMRHEFNSRHDFSKTIATCDSFLPTESIMDKVEAHLKT